LISQKHTNNSLTLTVKVFLSYLFFSLLQEFLGDSQNFLPKFVRFFVALGLKILRLLRLKELFKADIIKG